MKNEIKELLKKFEQKRQDGVNDLIKQLEGIENTFGSHSIKLHAAYNYAYEVNKVDDFYNFCEYSLENFNEIASEISNKYIKYSFEKKSVGIEYFKTSFYFDYVIDFEKELRLLKKFGELSLPYASAELLENSNALENYKENYFMLDCDYTEMDKVNLLNDLINELENDIKDTLKYFECYTKPIKEVYSYYIDFMENQVKYFKDYCEVD